MSLPQYVKGKMAEKFTESDPDSIYEVFQCALKLEIDGLVVHKIIPRKIRETIRNSETKKIIIGSLNAESLKIQTGHGTRSGRKKENIT